VKLGLARPWLLRAVAAVLRTAIAPLAAGGIGGPVAAVACGDVTARPVALVGGAHFIEGALVLFAFDAQALFVALAICLHSLMAGAFLFGFGGAPALALFDDRPVAFVDLGLDSESVSLDPGLAFLLFDVSSGWTGVDRRRSRTPDHEHQGQQPDPLHDPRLLLARTAGANGRAYPPSAETERDLAMATERLMILGASLKRRETIRESLVRLLAEVGLEPSAMDELSVPQLAVIVAQHRATNGKAA